MYQRRQQPVPQSTSQAWTLPQSSSLPTTNVHQTYLTPDQALNHLLKLHQFNATQYGQFLESSAHQLQNMIAGFVMPINHKKGPGPPPPPPRAAPPPPAQSAAPPSAPSPPRPPPQPTQHQSLKRKAWADEMYGFKKKLRANDEIPESNDEEDESPCKGKGKMVYFRAQGSSSTGVTSKDRNIQVAGTLA